MTPDQARGIRLLDGLANVLLDSRIGAKRKLVTPSGFLDLQVSTGYSIGRWLAQYSLADRERRSRFRILVDRRIDYIDCVENENLDSPDVEFRWSGAIARGLGAAFLADGLAVSILSDDTWNNARVRIDKSWIEGDDVATIALEVPHAAGSAHLDDSTEWLGRTQAPLPTNGMQLWDQRQNLFPRLEFCASAQEQIKSLGGDGRPLRSAARGLQDLQNYCASWTAGGFDIHAINNASGESKPTLEKYGAERTFRCARTTTSSTVTTTIMAMGAPNFTSTSGRCRSFQQANGTNSSPWCHRVTHGSFAPSPRSPALQPCGESSAIICRSARPKRRQYGIAIERPVRRMTARQTSRMMSEWKMRDSTARTTYRSARERRQYSHEHGTHPLGKPGVFLGAA